MKKINPEDKISFEYLINSVVNGDIYDCDIDRWLGVHLTSELRKEIGKSLRGMLCRINIS